ncbi:PREDICTED: SAC3 family protein B-like [Camelina sativa]|uniref:SAC3 family protein B-like n=1 Tax=Camelina sativa TaxID=90675 RepID=A0ABM1QAC1_CAMSA|nr:PREDICTED: SAC3 family protein B-like [Camelina sativa]
MEHSSSSTSSVLRLRLPQIYIGSLEPFNGKAWGSEAFPCPSPSVRPYQFPGVQRPTLNPQFGHDGSRNFLKDHGEHRTA